MVRVGLIDCVHSLPFSYALQKNFVPHNALLSFGTQKEISSLFIEGALDIAMISAQTFLEHRLDCILLSDLGIASSHEGMSIRLFSEKAIETDYPVFLPTHSPISVKIFTAICSRFWNVHPKICTYHETPETLLAQHIPFLAIGDQCLTLLEQHPEYPSIDLARTWNELTKKSLVFSVIATRNGVLQTNRSEVIDFHTALEKSYLWSQQSMPCIIQEAARKTRCSERFLEEHLRKPEYQLAPKHFHGLEFLSGCRS